MFFQKVGLTGTCNDANQGSNSNQLIRLALPVIAISFMSMAYSFINIFFVGKLGSNAVAAVGSASFYMNLSWGISALLTVGAGIKVSHAIGEKNLLLAKSYVRSGILATIIVAVVYYILMIVFSKYLIGFIRLNNAEIEKSATSYLLWIGVCIPFSFQNLFFSNVKAQSQANNYHAYVVLYGLNPVPFIPAQTGEYTDVWPKAKNHLQAMIALFQRLSINQKEYLKALGIASELTENPKQRKVYDVLDGILKMGYIPFHMEKANNYLKESQQNNYNFMGLEDMELSTQLILREALKRGISFEILDRKENFLRLKQNGNVQYIKQATKTSLDNYASILTMENKQVTKKILKEAGVRVPKGYEYTLVEVAKSDFSLLKGTYSYQAEPN